jgi:hypothetical protein
MARGRVPGLLNVERHDPGRSGSRTDDSSASSTAVWNRPGHSDMACGPVLRTLSRIPENHLLAWPATGPHRLDMDNRWSRVPAARFPFVFVSLSVPLHAARGGGRLFSAYRSANLPRDERDALDLPYHMLLPTLRTSECVFIRNNYDPDALPTRGKAAKGRE